MFYFDLGFLQAVTKIPLALPSLLILADLILFSNFSYFQINIKREMVKLRELYPVNVKYIALSLGIKTNFFNIRQLCLLLNYRVKKGKQDVN